MSGRFLAGCLVSVVALSSGGAVLAQNACPATCATGCQGASGVDHDGDCCCDDADNCPANYNPSQADTFGDPGKGDACEGDRVIYVSQAGTYPTPCAHDYTTIQEAVDSASPFPDAVYKISICTGMPEYHESVVLGASAAGKAFRFLGNPALGDVIIDGGSGPAFDVQTGNSRRAHAFHGLTLKGLQGIRASKDVRVEETSFRSIGDAAVVLDAGDHRLTRINVDSTVHDGLRVSSAATVDLSYGTFVGLTGTPITVDGSMTIDGSLFAASAGGAAIRLGSAASSVGIQYSTIADGAQVGIDNYAGGSVTIETSILYNNSGGDLVSVPCASVSWSDVGTPDCTSFNGTLSQNPRFVGGGDYHLTSASPMIDHGPSPASYTGLPCEDLDRGPRLLDYDQDGIATVDPGPYEKQNWTPDGPGEPPAVRFTTKTIFAWDATALPATEYHDYRGLLSDLGYGDFGSCVDALDASHTDLQFVDVALPPPGDGFFYLVTAEDASGESTLGMAACAERSNLFACQ